MNKKQPKLSLAVLVIKFPNPVQSYINRQLAEQVKRGYNLGVFARANPKPKTLQPELQYILDNLIPHYSHIENKGKTLLRAAYSILFPLTRIRRKLIQSATNVISEYGLKYWIRSLSLASAPGLEKIEIIHSHSLFTAYDYLVLSKYINIPMIVTFHGLVPRGVKNLPGEKLKKLFTAAQTFVVNSNYSQNLLEDMGCPGHKIVHIPQGIDINLFDFHKRHINSDDEISVITVGRLSIEKGHRIAVEAIARLRHQYPNIHYHIVGNGPEKNNLQYQVDNLKLNNNVTLHGFKTGSELEQLFNQSKIFILPSIDTNDGYLVETQGVVLQEAQAYGLPVIASSTGGIPDFITDGQTGLLFQSENDLELSQKLIQLIEDKMLYEKLSLNGRQYVEENIDIRVTCDKLEKLYLDAIAMGRD